MAKTSTLYNDGTSLSPSFTTHAGTPSASGGNLVLAAGDKIKTVATDWDLTASSLRVNISNYASGDMFYLVFDSGVAVKPAMRMYFAGWNAGFFNGAADNSANFGSFAFSGSQAQYAHISESGGFVYYGTSTDGVTVTNFYNTNSFSAPSACTIYLLSDVTTVLVDEIGVASASSVAFRPYYITG